MSWVIIVESWCSFSARLSGVPGGGAGGGGGRRNTNWRTWVIIETGTCYVYLRRTILDTQKFHNGLQLTGQDVRVCKSLQKSLYSTKYRKVTMLLTTFSVSCYCTVHNIQYKENHLGSNRLQRFTGKCWGRTQPGVVYSTGAGVHSFQRKKGGRSCSQAQRANAAGRCQTEVADYVRLPGVSIEKVLEVSVCTGPPNHARFLYMAAPVTHWRRNSDS